METEKELQYVIQQAKQYNLIPIERNILADTETPIRLFHHFEQEPYAFLLESVEGGTNWARYSFIGTDPFLHIRGKKGAIEIDLNGKKQTLTDKPMQALKQLLARYQSPKLEDMPRFTGGAVGFFGYDLIQYYENIPPHRIDDLNMQDIQFMFCDQIIVFDHLKQQVKVIGNVHVHEGDSIEDITQAYQLTVQKLQQTIQRIHQPLHIPMFHRSSMAHEVDLENVVSNISKEDFMRNVDKAKDYIASGDIFQVVLSQRFEMESEASPLHVYRVLRTMNPSPYMYMLKLGDEVIVGTSPELLVRVEGDRVETRPIAGTRPRGRNEEEDIALEHELLHDEKERAEHVMLVDLGRNDIGRVAKYGTVEVDSYMDIERYSHVMHIVSNVSGELQEEKDFFDAFISCMPAGTVSGAPKIRAMEIIAELEQEARGAYAGAIGYLGFNGNLDTCITIRTIIFKGNKAYVQAGAGVVYDSIPEKEYEETVNKAKALLTSIKVAENIFTKEEQVAL
ncbi:anthranilate synthase component I [Longirhabdus pacifica]|uniref:anthranilate synthase component I n=1 Tax=Longirhabdus pacifica TaxID=2305227 RepID=UPI0010092E72|nr:anthranilate synthase component I [Longirhabdus pacifica]